MPEAQGEVGEFVRFSDGRLWRDYGLERPKVRKRSFA